jgi:hypothetical protein
MERFVMRTVSVVEDQTTDPSRPVPSSNVRGRTTGARAAGSPFDILLKRNLHGIFDEVLKEPLPAALLELLANEAGNQQQLSIIKA